MVLLSIGPRVALYNSLKAQPMVVNPSQGKEDVAVPTGIP